MVQTPAKRTRQLYPPQTWAKVRADYLAGKTATWCAETHGVSKGALKNRAAREGWTKQAAWAEEEARLAADAARAAADREAARPAEEPLDASDPVIIADAALNRALEALDRGQAAEAQGLIKAGNAVGEFAEFVKALKKERVRPPE